MALLFGFVIFLPLFYLWLRGRWVAGVALAVAWSFFAGATCTVPQFAFILAFSFAPMLGWMAWRRRIAIYNVFAEANGWQLRT